MMFSKTFLNKSSLLSFAVLTAFTIGCGQENQQASGTSPQLIDSDNLLFSAAASDICSGSSNYHKNFRELWSKFDQKYATFDVRLKDESWQQIGKRYCNDISSNMGNAAFYDVLLDMLRELDDGHINLVSKNPRRDNDAWVSVYPYYKDMYKMEGNIEKKYIDGKLKYAAADEFAWGKIGNIGYISITSLDDLSSSGNEGKDRKAAKKAMNKALKLLKNSKGIVIDIRANEGGWDSVGLDVARYFAGKKTVAWSKQVRNGPNHDDFSAPKPTYVQAANKKAYKGPVVLLTSGGTFSAAETFALAMRVRDNVTILGEQTSGHFSDLIDGKLSNKWKFTYSGERYIAADGNVYEAMGVPVDVSMPFEGATLDAFRKQKKDLMLEKAIDLINK